MHARNIKLTIEYDGTDFAGWQVQPDERTVQGSLEEALADLSGDEVRVHGAGRTDAGVHALGQVAHVLTALELAPERIRQAVNARLDDDVSIVAAEEVPESFHARFDATSRSYVYLMGVSESPIWRRNRWHVRSELDIEAMRGATRALLGEKDFSSFCLTGSEPNHHKCCVTGISLDWEPGFGGMMILRIRANRFLRGMVRSIVGTLVDVGKGRTTPGGFADILAARDRGAAGATAPPWGLYLEDVRYGEALRYD